MRTLTRAAASGMCSLLLLTSGVAWADFTPIQLPDAQYVAETTLLNITDPDFSTIPSLSDGVETVSFDIDLVVLTVPATWGTWGAPPNTETTTPTVLWTGGFTTLTMTLSAPAFVFGFEAQPNALFPADISVNFFDGAMLVARFRSTWMALAVRACSRRRRRSHRSPALRSALPATSRSGSFVTRSTRFPSRIRWRSRCSDSRW